MSNYPIIVLEGPDGAGKTTLSKKILEHCGGGKYLHLTYRFKDRMHLYHTAAFEQCLRYAEHQWVVLDRWWPSEQIYADHYRGGTAWPMMGRMLDRVAIQHNVLYIDCVPLNREQYYEQYERLKNVREEMYDSVTGLLERYMAYANKFATRPDHIHYDIFEHGKNLDYFAQHVIDRTYPLRSDTPDWWRNRRQRTVTGQGDRPTILFVGDRSNPKTRRKIWPFFEHAYSSLWFAGALATANVSEWDVAYINAYNHGTLQDDLLKRTMEEVRPRNVVALGVHAAHGLSKVGTGFVQVHHPAFYKRFKRGDPSELHAALDHIRGHQ